IYASLHEQDITNVKILSHKLKGVAANLRVADALEALTIVNTSADFPAIHSNLDRFYRIISKLSGEMPESIADTAHVRSDEDEFVVDFKDESEDDLVLDFKNKYEFATPEELNIHDSDVPNIIEMPELADDDFSPTQIKDTSSDLLDIDFDTVDANELSLELANIDELPDTLDVIEGTDTLELLHITEKKEIKPVTLLQTQEKPNVKIDYKPEAVANEIGIDIESFHELFDDFLDESQVKCRQIRTAINDGNSDLWKAKAIKLKGMSENMRIKELSYELDTIIRTSDSNAALESINKIDAMMSQISLKGA
ncbi:MAG: hypothetical protein KKG59_06285, partial [Nanoarchaeota archaeon]|nr:hypothetical protein [Nanoarchaeota archaeon]